MHRHVGRPLDVDVLEALVIVALALALRQRHLLGALSLELVAFMPLLQVARLAAVVAFLVALVAGA